MKKKIAIIGLTGQSIFLNIDNFHKDGETKQANNLYIEPGGKGYNQAVACKKLGSEVYFLTSVGEDEYGKVCEQVLIDLGVNTYFSKKDESTALATIITNSNGDNQVTVYKGASDLLNLNDLNNFKEIIILKTRNEIDEFIKKLNQIIVLNSTHTYKVADIYTSFKSNTSDIPLTNVGSFDIHPNKYGHQLIFEVNKSVLGSQDSFNDINNHWAKDLINKFASKGHILGYGDKTFRPENSMTRAEFVTLFNRVFGLTKANGNVFNDTAISI